ncbi:MAG: acyltransferase family protein [Verrucomicrobiia bacterium]
MDFLRGMAILLVLGRHQPVYPSEAGSSWFRYFPAVLSRFGWTGVDLFFVLSGFLVGGLLFKEFNTQKRMDHRAVPYSPDFQDLALVLCIPGFPLCAHDGDARTR